MPEDIKKKQQMMKDYEDKQELLKKKLEEAKASAESIGRQRPSEPEGEPKRKRTPEQLSQKGSDDERNLENVDKKWLTKYEDKLNCFWCKGTVTKQLIARKCMRRPSVSRQMCRKQSSKDDICFAVTVTCT